MNSLFDFYTYLSKRAKPLAEEVVEIVLTTMELNIPEWEKEQAILTFAELLQFVGEASMHDEENTVPANFIGWSKKNAAMQVASGGEISEIVVRYPPTRDAFTDIISRVSTELNLSIKECAFLIKQINNMLDRSLNETVFAFERFSNEYKEKTKKELAELSAPIVPVKDGIVILPLIGDIDAYRANYIMENVVPRLAEKNVDHLIADFSGILTINAQVAAHLHQIGNMLRLMGIHVVSTGFRPELTKAVIDSNIDLSKIESFSTVKEALKSIG